MPENNKNLNSIYRQLKSLQKQTPDNGFIIDVIVKSYNKIIEELDSLVEKDCKDFMLLHDSIVQNYGRDNTFYQKDAFKAKLALAIGFLEDELGINENTENAMTKTIVNVLNQNENTLAVDIKTTINQLIEQQGNEEVKKQLKELNEAIKQKDENKLKRALIWLLENSFGLAIKILPELLKRWGL